MVLIRAWVLRPMAARRQNDIPGMVVLYIQHRAKNRNNMVSPQDGSSSPRCIYLREWKHQGIESGDPSRSRVCTGEGFVGFIANIVHSRGGARNAERVFENALVKHRGFEDDGCDFVVWRVKIHIVTCLVPDRFVTSYAHGWSIAFTRCVPACLWSLRG